MEDLYKLRSCYIILYRYFLFNIFRHFSTKGLTFYFAAPYNVIELYFKGVFFMAMSKSVSIALRQKDQRRAKAQQEKDF